MVSKPPLQVQEAVEEWRNTPGADRSLRRVPLLQLPADGVGLSAEPENEQCGPQPQFTSELQPPAPRGGALLPGQLLVVRDELCGGASAALPGPAPPSPPQRCLRQRRDYFLKPLWTLDRIILVKKNTRGRDGHDDRQCPYSRTSSDNTRPLHARI